MDFKHMFLLYCCFTFAVGATLRYETSEEAVDKCSYLNFLFIFCTICDDDHPTHPFYCCKCACFPGTAKVNLQNGEDVQMSELKIGDLVKTASPGGGIGYSEVREFMKIQHIGMVMYKAITTSCNKTIVLSGEHLIYARGTSLDKYHPIFADKVTTNYEVLLESGDEFTPASVTNVSSIMMQGAYTPITKEGNIVVEGILSSCYAVVPHDLAHIVMAPIRWFPEAMELIFGKTNGSLEYVNAIIGIEEWVSLFGNKIN